MTQEPYAAEPTRALCERIANEVRGEIEEYFGFCQPQAARLVGLCGEGAFRVQCKLAERRLPASVVSIRIASPENGQFAHVFVLCGGIIIDPTISQFADRAYSKYLARVLPEDTYCFSADAAASFLSVEGAYAGPPYPVGPLTSACATSITRESVYASRSYMLYSFPTRFSADESDLHSLRPFARAWDTGELEWRRTCAAGLENFCGHADPPLRTFATRMLNYPDDLIRTIASKHYQALTSAREAQ